ncbi:MAG: PhzF family phenazine biosynthesis protein [Acidobacteriia bacterium]|nr:PhzF family phenazine biosynthesis protein [Terriglobia bacterium]
MSVRITQVDAFTDRPFAGNPAAVCLLPEPRPDAFMRDVAREMNLSETAFLVQRGGDFDLRWFTPTVEVDLCGHATLASAHVLWEEGRLPSDAAARFHTRSGLLTAEKRGTLIEMDFPAEPATESEESPDLEHALGVRPTFVGRNRLDLLVEVESEETVRLVSPDFTWLRAITTRGVIVTSRSSSPDRDFVSRFFAPAAGIDEDPVTGSSHCCLGPYWGAKLGRPRLVGYQASARGGTVNVRLNGDRVILGGTAVTVLRAELL